MKHKIEISSLPLPVPEFIDLINLISSKNAKHYDSLCPGKIGKKSFSFYEAEHDLIKPGTDEIIGSRSTKEASSEISSALPNSNRIYIAVLKTSSLGSESEVIHIVLASSSSSSSSSK